MIPVQELIGHVIRRELRALRRELEAYEDERDLWATPPGITSSAGTLTLHLVGNLRHFLGTVLGSRGYVRNRAAEFAERDVPREELLEAVKRAAADVRSALAALGPEDLELEYPQPVGGVHVQTGDFLIHLAAHLAYHLGQIDYHRRMVTGQAYGVDALAIPELRTADPPAAPE